MTRLRYITEDELDEDQRKIWEPLISSRGSAGTLVNDDGGLIGPFNSMLYSPAIGARVSALGAAVRFGSDLPPNVAEVAILTVGAHWRSNFEFWAHSRLGRDAGLPDHVIDAISTGEQPNFDDEREALAHAMARMLLQSGRVDDETYGEVVESFGSKGAVELTTLIGYYCLISLTLNTFAVELPSGVESIWPT